MTSNPMIEGRRADSARRRQRVIKAINQAASTGGERTVSAIARAAGVDRTFLYRHRDLLGQLRTAASEPTSGPDGGPLVSRASLQADLAAAQQRATGQATRTRQPERKLAELLGERAWHESGLGAPDDIEQLKRRITDLEQHLAELTGRLDDTGQQLEAARAANRELMTQLNAAGRDRPR
jgi:hypothetical protein